MTTLGDLLAALPQARIVNAPPEFLTVPVAAIAIDSRSVRPGTLFFALRGTARDGHDFVPGAFRDGALACVVDEPGLAGLAAEAGQHGPLVVVPAVARALSSAADRFFDEPSRALDVVGVTGTNGKTTTTFLIEAALEAGGIPAGHIGTLGARFHERETPLQNTTPLALELQATLAAMRDAGARAVALEVSSHALALDRVSNVRFATAVLTNVTRDHLDFHPGFDAYAAAKRSLFERGAPAVLNLDDPLGARWAAELAAARGATVTTYAQEHPDADLRATDVAVGADGSHFRVDGESFDLAIPGRFNISNALATIAVARSFGVPDRTTAHALRAFERVPGRMELVEGGGVVVVVDYAHTPDALATVLRAARDLTRGRLHVVFGCGGDRDAGKRPIMGRTAIDEADRVVITSDNPRSESAAAIAGAILAGMPAGARRDAHASIELDRRAAIRRAILDARPGDLVVVAGKGHETYQIVGPATLPFDDVVEVRAALALREAAV